MNIKSRRITNNSLIHPTTITTISIAKNYRHYLLKFNIANSIAASFPNNKTSCQMTQIYYKNNSIDNNKNLATTILLTTKKKEEFNNKTENTKLVYCNKINNAFKTSAKIATKAVKCSCCSASTSRFVKETEIMKIKLCRIANKNLPTITRRSLLRTIQSSLWTSKNSSHIQQQTKKLRLDNLPSKLLNKIGDYLFSIDILNIQKVCKKFETIFAKNFCIKSIEIRAEYNTTTSANITRNSTKLLSKMANLKPKIHTYHIKITDKKNSILKWKSKTTTNPEKALINFLEKHSNNIRELIIWDVCLSNRQKYAISGLKSLETLKLWNCSRYFKQKSKNKKSIITTLISLPNLKQLLILNTENLTTNNLSKIAFSEKLAQKICAPIENLQITGLELPLQTIEVIVEKCFATLQRLSIGCTFGNAAESDKYLILFQKMKKLNNLDLPPFIFKLEDFPNCYNLLINLLENLQIKSFGFRHCNSLELFNFIEMYLPKCVNVLRCYHDSNRIPYFALLGVDRADFYNNHKHSRCSNDNNTCDDISSVELITTTLKKKFSLLSQYSFLSSTPSSLGVEEMSASTSMSGIKCNSASSTIKSTTSNNNTITKFFEDHAAATLEQQQQQQKLIASTSSCFSSCSNSSALSTTTTSSNNCNSLKITPASSFDNHKKNKFSFNIDESSQRSPTKTTSCDAVMDFELSATESIRREQQQELILEMLQARQLTIFAISEGKSTRINGAMKVHERCYNGVDVVYTQDHVDSQPLLGRMAILKCSSSKMPYVYEKSLGNSAYIGDGIEDSQHRLQKRKKRDNRIRLINGDLVKTIPFSCMGMETDYDGIDLESAF